MRNFLRARKSSGARCNYNKPRFRRHRAKFGQTREEIGNLDGTWGVFDLIWDQCVDVGQ